MMNIYVDDNVIINNEIMPNGEKRYRIIGNDGGSYIRTIAETATWEKSHYHNSITEMYIIQKGWVIFVQYINDKELLFTKYSAGDHFISKPMTPHNVYMSEGTITHTVKYGDSIDLDWNEFKKLDKLIDIIDSRKYLAKEINDLVKINIKEQENENWNNIGKVLSS